MHSCLLRPDDYTWFAFCLVFWSCLPTHDDVFKWKHFPRYWPFVWGIHRSPVNSPHKGRWRRALMFSLICAWINGWESYHEASDLRRHCAHYDVIVMLSIIILQGYFNAAASCRRLPAVPVKKPWQISVNESPGSPGDVDKNDARLFWFSTDEYRTGSLHHITKYLPKMVQIANGMMFMHFKEHLLVHHLYHKLLDFSIYFINIFSTQSLIA